MTAKPKLPQVPRNRRRIVRQKVPIQLQEIWAVCVRLQLKSHSWCFWYQLWSSAHALTRMSQPGFADCTMMVQ